jgi:hypothetical protein
MDLFEETLAEVEGKDGERYLVRRNPARAKELAASRPDKLATLRTAGPAPPPNSIRSYPISDWNPEGASREDARTVDHQPDIATAISPRRAAS